MHQAFASALEQSLDRIAEIKADPGREPDTRPAWPMIVLQTPRG